jgi:hypothetical protein
VASTPVIRIVSGGQTGADRGALDAAIALGLPHGGWCPRGRRAEDGVIPDRYLLDETGSRQYAARTERNVIDSDGTLIVIRGRLQGGSALTARVARARGKPCLIVDMARDTAGADEIRDWLRKHAIAVLNVAGPRESHCPGIGEQVKTLLIETLGSSGSRFQVGPVRGPVQ